MLRAANWYEYLNFDDKTQYSSTSECEKKVILFLNILVPLALTFQTILISFVLSLLQSHLSLV